MNSKLDFIVPNWPAPFNVKALQTTRLGGASTGPYASLNLGLHVGDDPLVVALNRQLLMPYLPTSPIWINQVHGVVVINASNSKSLQDADASFSTDTNVVCVTMTADCLPVLLCDANGSVVAAVHAGWRGLAARVIPEALKYFEDSSLVIVGIGPRISPEAYQVDTDVASNFVNIPRAVLPDTPGHARLDLAEISRSQLTESGVPEQNITTSAQITDGGEFFFSDRAMRPCGRFALVAKRKS